jgi:hypothetical protein
MSSTKGRAVRTAVPKALGAGRRRHRQVLPAALLGVVVAICAPGTTMVASAGPTPPSWLDIVAQMGQVAHGQDKTLLSLDATLRDALNGTTAGYVYSLVSDAVQMSTSLKDLLQDIANLTGYWSRGHAQGARAVAGYNHERQYYADWYRLMHLTPSPCYGSSGGSGTATDRCAHDLVMVIHWWEDYPKSTSLGPPETVGATVSSTSVDAYYQYTMALDTLTEVLTDASEVALEARAITGDAHDYPANKEIEAIVQVIGEHNVASEMAKFTEEATGLRPHLQAQVTEMGTANDNGHMMSGLAAVGVDSMVPPPPLT